VVGNAAVLTAAGIAAGLVIALAASRVMTMLVFGVSARDPIRFALVPIVLAMVAVATALVPACRATRVDPMRALRAD
jgi:putative ABC transport system permease protein